MLPSSQQSVHDQRSNPEQPHTPPDTVKSRRASAFSTSQKSLFFFFFLKKEKTNKKTPGSMINKWNSLMRVKSTRFISDIVQISSLCVFFFCCCCFFVFFCFYICFPQKRNKGQTHRMESLFSQKMFSTSARTCVPSVLSFCLLCFVSFFPPSSYFHLIPELNSSCFNGLLEGTATHKGKKLLSNTLTRQSILRSSKGEN